MRREIAAAIAKSNREIPHCYPATRQGGLITPVNANIRETPDIDSFDFLRLLTALSGKPGVDVPEADYAKLGTLESMTCYLAKRAG